jgi:hypothetical protein
VVPRQIRGCCFGEGGRIENAVTIIKLDLVDLSYCTFLIGEATLSKILS